MKSSGGSAGSGLTRAHTWGLIVPILAVLCLPLLSKYLRVSSAQPVNAVVAGVACGLISYLLFRYVPGLVEQTHVLAKATLIGLLIAECLVLQPYGKLPPMSTITLWLFFYYHTVEEHL